MATTSELAGTLARLAAGHPGSREDREIARAYLANLDACEGDDEKRNLRDAQKPTVVTLANGDVVDVFPSGTVRVYSHDLTRACEITLPRATTEGGTVTIRNLG